MLICVAADGEDLGRYSRHLSESGLAYSECRDEGSNRRSWKPSGDHSSGDACGDGTKRLDRMTE